MTAEERLAKADKLTDEIAEYQKSFPHLNPDKAQFMHFIFGPEITVPVNGDFEPPPSPNTSIKQAGVYVFHQEDKGFVKISNGNKEDPLSIYSSAIRKISQRPRKPVRNPNGVSEEEEEELRRASKDPEHQQLMNMNCVLSSLKEMEKLPFVFPNDFIIVKDKFRSKVSSVARTMLANGDFDWRKKKRRELQHATTTYVKTVYRLLDEVVFNALRAKQIVYNELTRENVNSFREPIKKYEATLPPSSPQKTVEEPKPTPKRHGDDILAKIFEHNSKPISVLPKVYQPTVFNLDEKGQKKVTKQIATSIRNCNNLLSKMEPSRPSTAQDRPWTTPARGPRLDLPTHKCNVITNHTARRPEPVIPEKPHKRARTAKNGRKPKREPTDILKRFWEFEDPLTKRTGDFISPGDLFKKTANIDSLDLTTKIDPESIRIDLDFKTPPPTAPDSNREANMHIYIPEGQLFPQSETEEEEKREVDARITVPTYELTGNNKDALEYLLSLPPEKGGDEVHNQLDLIWDSLGFSIQQKLNMLLKYSRDIEESNKLGEALGLWTQALENITVYHHSYIAIKDFLRLDADIAGGRRDVLLDQLLGEFKNAEESVKHIALLLRQNCGDELIIKRRRAEELLEMRRETINMKLSNAGLLDN